MNWLSRLAEKAKDVIIEVGAYVANLGNNLVDRVEGYFMVGDIASEPAKEVTTEGDVVGLDYRQPFLSEQEALDYLADVAAPSRIVTVSHEFINPDTGEYEETLLYYPVIEDSP